jgi:hypothetical protein
MMSMEVVMRRRDALGAIALVTAGCGHGGGLGDPLRPRTESINTQMMLFPDRWTLGKAQFDAGPGEVTVAVRLESPLPLTWAVGLRFWSGTGPSDQGDGGSLTSGPGPLLSGRWDVRATGRYEAFVYLPGRLPTLPVPAEGVPVPLAFTITHA